MNKNSTLLSAFFVSATLLIMMLSALLVKQSFIATPSYLGVSTERTSPIAESPSKAVQLEQKLNIASKIVGTTEKILIEADPQVTDANIWLIRLKIKGGEILGVNNLVDSMLPACANRQSINLDEICVDVVKEGNFMKGDKAIEVIVKWDDPDGGEIIRMGGDAFYNGKTLDYSNAVQPQVAGVDTTADSSNVTVSLAPTTIILIGIGIVLIVVAGVGFYLTLRDQNKNPNLTTTSATNQNPSKMLVMASIVMMTAGTVFSAALLTNNNTAPEDTSALTVTPTTTSEVEPTNTPIIFTATPTQTVGPTVIYYTTIPHTSTPAPTSSPTPSVTPINKPPLTDNIVCGPLDVNGDLKLDYIDYVVFNYMYGYHCSDAYPAINCGGKDTNGDGVINYIDLSYFQANYYPKTLNCSVED